MYIGLPTLGLQSRRGSAAPAPAPPSANLLKHWKLNTGLTQAGGFASGWTDQIGGTVLAQATGANQPAVQGDGSLLFDGANDFMAVAFTLNQPCTTYFLCKQVTWSSNDYMCDGAGASNHMTIAQQPETPNLIAYAGNTSLPVAPALDTYGVVATVWNGASSVLQLDDGTPVTGDFGNLSPNGLSLCINGNLVSNHGHFQFKEILIYDAPHDATQRAEVRDYMATVP